VSALRLRLLALFIDETSGSVESIAAEAGGPLVLPRATGGWAWEPSEPACWALCDGRPSRACLALCKRLGTSRLLSLRPLRSAGGTCSTSAWRTVHLDVVHSAVGGVSDRMVRVYFTWDPSTFAPDGPLPGVGELPMVAPRDLSTVLDSTIQVRRLCPAPGLPRVLPLQVQELQPGPPPIFHGGGLLPCSAGPHPLIACPTIWRDPKVTWGVRRLTTKEYLGAMGLPRAAVDLLLACGFTDRALVSPAECLLAAFQVYSRVRSYSDVGHGGV
jgi:hypothetical protein